MIKYQVAHWEGYIKHDILVLISKSFNVLILNTGSVRDFPFVPLESLLYHCWAGFEWSSFLTWSILHGIISQPSRPILFYLCSFSEPGNKSKDCITKCLSLESSFMSCISFFLLLIQNSLSFHTFLYFIQDDGFIERNSVYSFVELIPSWNSDTSLFAPIFSSMLCFIIKQLNFKKDKIQK